MSVASRPMVRPISARPTPPEPELMLANGLRLVASPLPDRGFTAMHLMVGAGGRTDPAPVIGIGALLAAVCAEGSAGRSADAFAEVLERHGATLTGGADTDGAYLTVAAPAEHIVAVAGLLAETVAAPALREEQVRRAVARRRAAIGSERLSPPHRARNCLRRLSYRPDSPYGWASGGTVDSVAAIDAAAVASHHQRWYGPANTWLLVVGEVGPAVTDGVAAAFSGWRHEVAPEDPPRPRPARSTVWQVVRMPGARQVTLTVGGAVRATGRSELAALEVAVHALGGWSGSRLNRSLRDQLGYTYGFQTEFVPRRVGADYGAEFRVYGSVDVGVVDDAVARLIAECTDVAAGGLSPAEIGRARDNVASRALLITQTVRHVVDSTGGRIRRGYRGVDLTARGTDLTGVSVDEVSRSAGTHLAPGRLQFVAAGEPADCERAVMSAAHPVAVDLSRAVDGKGAGSEP